ncbi:hypothetical protein LSAT2_032130, partial [Lamellibrachia satsuma]
VHFDCANPQHQQPCVFLRSASSLRFRKSFSIVYHHVKPHYVRSSPGTPRQRGTCERFITSDQHRHRILGRPGQPGATRAPSHSVRLTSESGSCRCVGGCYSTTTKS